MTGYMQWWTDDDQLVIGLDNGDGTVTAPSESGNTIRIYGNLLYDEFGTDTGDLSEVCPLPATFHQYIVDGAIAEGYALPGADKGMLMLFDQRFTKGIARGQIYSSRERVNDNAQMKVYSIFQVDA